MDDLENRIATYLQDQIPCAAATDYRAKARHVIAEVGRPLAYPLERMIRSFDGDPPDSEFQRGFLAALVELGDCSKRR